MVLNPHDRLYEPGSSCGAGISESDDGVRLYRSGFSVVPTPIGEAVLEVFFKEEEATTRRGLSSSGGDDTTSLSPPLRCNTLLRLQKYGTSNLSDIPRTTSIDRNAVRVETKSKPLKRSPY
jgi:hypothetical protein